MLGKFVWYDLNTKDSAAAEAFYAGLFGWTFLNWKPEGAPADMPEYKMICLGEMPFGGVNQMPPEVPAPAHWMGHVEVDDVDAAMARAEKLGATFMMGAMDVPTVGRMAIMMDPEGCVVSLFKPLEETPAIPSGTEHGMVGWNELAVSDDAKAKAFYSEVIGWKWRDGAFDSEMHYYLFGTGEEGGDYGGMMRRDPSMPMSSWLLYFTTKNLAETVAKATELGGSVIAPPFEVDQVGKLAVCAAPDGSVFGVAEWAPMPAAKA